MELDGVPVVGEVGELVITEPMPSMPVRLWGDEDGPLPRELLRHLSRRLAARRLDRDHRTGHRDHHRSLRRDDQPRRDPHGDVGDLPCRAVARRGRGRARRRPAAQGPQGYMPLFVVPRNGIDLDDELVARIRTRIRGLLAAPCAGRDPSDRRGPPHAVGQESSRCPSSGFCRGSPSTRRSAVTRWRTPTRYARSNCSPNARMEERVTCSRSRPLRAHAVSEDGRSGL